MSPHPFLHTPRLVDCPPKRSPLQPAIFPPTCRERAACCNNNIARERASFPGGPGGAPTLYPPHTATIDGLSPARPLALAPPDAQATAVQCSRPWQPDLSTTPCRDIVAIPKTLIPNTNSSQAAYKKGNHPPVSPRSLHRIHHLQAPARSDPFPLPRPLQEGHARSAAPPFAPASSCTGSSQLERASPLLSGRASRHCQGSSSEQRRAARQPSYSSAAQQCSAAQCSAVQRSAARPRAEPGGVV